MGWETWVFSGFGVAIPLALIGWYLSRKSEGAGGVTQRQSGGNGSVNIQAGHDVTVRDVNRRDEVG
jgi:hypothetical protein